MDLASEGPWGHTPLSPTAGNGHEAMVKLLLKTEQLDVDSTDSGGWTGNVLTSDPQNNDSRCIRRRRQSFKRLLVAAPTR